MVGESVSEVMKIFLGLALMIPDCEPFHACILSKEKSFKIDFFFLILHSHPIMLC